MDAIRNEATDDDNGQTREAMCAAAAAAAATEAVGSQRLHVPRPERVEGVEGQGTTSTTGRRLSVEHSA